MANIYVRKSGSDSNDGSTPALAKLTIAGALAVVSTGDTIVFGSGLYAITAATSVSIDCDIFGDITGELTGDAGEVIFHGVNLSTSAFYSYSANVFSFTGTRMNIKNILFTQIKAEDRSIISGDGVEIENCNFLNINCASLISGSFLVKNVHIKSIYRTVGKDLYVITRPLTVATHQKAINYENILIEDCFISYNTSNIRTIYPFRFDVSQGLVGYDHIVNIKNVTISGNFGNHSNTTGFYLYSTYITSTDITVTIDIENVNFDNLGTVFQIGYGGTGSIAYSGNVTGINYFRTITTPTVPAGITLSGVTNLPSFQLSDLPRNSKFSLNCNNGTSDCPALDLAGNPRPKYGNTNCDVGAIESTSDTIQKESTVKDSGDFSMKVAPCNYFKRVFQIPVTASELRTVKVKIRIDGTWGTYLPRVSLSGQGMTLSQATKNSTTGSFEELTVSGTPTSTGIALLTIEAHSASTDAAFYIDTITIE